MSPTARSLKHLRDGGALAQVVERWNPYARRRVDLFGFIDIVALDHRPGVLGVQATSTTNLSHRLLKARTECAEAMTRWLFADNRLVLHGWSKKGPRGARKVWTLVERPITKADLMVEKDAMWAGEEGPLSVAVEAEGKGRAEGGSSRA